MEEQFRPTPILQIHREQDTDMVIALAGNPNVGKSTVFNTLTGMRQHTGNWPGKTVASAQGRAVFRKAGYVLVDLPGTYSLMAHSTEEEIARDFLLFGGAEAAVVVCDATCLERNLNLVLQTLELAPRTVVCVNLMDEAAKKGVKLDLPKLEHMLGVPVVGTSARENKGLDELMTRVEEMVAQREKVPFEVRYAPAVEEAVSILQPVLSELPLQNLPTRFAALKLLEGDQTLLTRIKEQLGLDLPALLSEPLSRAREALRVGGCEDLENALVAGLYREAERLAAACLTQTKEEYQVRQWKLDKLLTGKWTGTLIMLLLLAVVFYITIAGANVPSRLLSQGLFWVGDRFSEGLLGVGAPEWLRSMLVDGIYRVLAWVVSVMLPPMAIFFPLFTLLEDLGMLPRVAFNLDHRFRKCNACGKQSLTHCMGFGCNAAGGIGCRIIDSPRERLIAILTNNFAPCNGRFPTLIAILTIFFVGTAARPGDGAVAALLLTSIIALGVMATFLSSWLLSKTILKGEASAFTLELPPFRRPQIGKVIVRSIFDRTLFVLSRAVAIAAPAGLVIWILANVQVGGLTLLAHGTAFLDPFARFFGLDGVILMAFILGLPANEIVIPIILMTYLSRGSILEYDSLASLSALLTQNGWTWVTAVCVVLFCLMHWPCSTTLLTIKKETGSLKWMAVGFLLPTIFGLAACALVANLARLFGLA